MIEPCMYYRIVSTDDIPAGGLSRLGTTVGKINDISPLTQPYYISYANKHFERIYSMVRDLCNQLTITSTVDAWYTRDLMKTYDSSLQNMQCPLFTQYPDRFKIHDNEFSVLSLIEIADMTIFMNAEKLNSQLWAQNYKTSGWHWRWDTFNTIYGITLPILCP